jgi:hypothetical protein
MTDVYVYIGHGWSTGLTINISKLNVKIIMLRNEEILYENFNTKHLQLLSQVGKKFTAKDYMKQLYKIGTECQNEFCIFDSKIQNLVPDLLLTTYSKNNEVTRLQKVGKIKSLECDKVIMLSDLIKLLNNNFILKLYTCREKLDQFQIDNLYIFGEGYLNIKKKISAIKEKQLYEKYSIQLYNYFIYNGDI